MSSKDAQLSIKYGRFKRLLQLFNENITSFESNHSPQVTALSTNKVYKHFPNIYQ